MKPTPQPRYVSPKQRAERRAYYLRLAYWTAVALPVIVFVMMLGYSDQMPAGVRRTVEQIDAVFGFPVLRLVALIAG